MAESSLCLHTGGREVTLEELQAVKTPEGTRTWFPVPHVRVVKVVGEALNNAGFTVRRAVYGLARNDARMFATLDLDTHLAQGVSLAVGVRNSCDKSFPLGFVAGNRVFVCDNLAFRSEISVMRKHTRNGNVRFKEAIMEAVQHLAQFREVEGKRIDNFRSTTVAECSADSIILRAYERGILSSHTLPDAIKYWREPEHEEFQPRTLWSLFNAFTSALGSQAKSNPQKFTTATMAVNGLLDEYAVAV